MGKWLLTIFVKLVLPTALHHSNLMRPYLSHYGLHTGIGDTFRLGHERSMDTERL